MLKLTPKQFPWGGQQVRKQVNVIEAPGQNYLQSLQTNYSVSLKNIQIMPHNEYTNRQTNRQCDIIA